MTMYSFTILFNWHRIMKCFQCEKCVATIKNETRIKDQFAIKCFKKNNYVLVFCGIPGHIV